MSITKQFVVPPMPITKQIKHVYPWETAEIGMLYQRLYALASETGYTGTFNEFKQGFGAYLEANNIITTEDFERYMGQYEIIPLPLMEQILQTKDKVLSDDITVAAIPFATTTNSAGGYTAVIG